MEPLESAAAATGRVLNWLLDTNILRALMTESPDPALSVWLRGHANDCCLSAISLAEIARGVERLAPGKKQSRLRHRLRYLREDYASRVLPFDDAVAMRWGEYCAECERSGTRPPVMDSLIAATALYFGLEVVTHNAKDFPGVQTVSL